MSFAEDRKASTASAGRRKSVADNQVTSVLSANEVAIFDRELTADEETLAALGYKYEMSRNDGGTYTDSLRTDLNSSASSPCGRLSVFLSLC